MRGFLRKVAWNEMLEVCGRMQARLFDSGFDVVRGGMAEGDGEQRIFTPDELARDIVSHFRPSGRLLEPCKGDGAFLRAMPGCDWFEIAEGSDFLTATGEWDWIVTNPPWRDVGPFLEKAMQCADNIVFLCWASAWWSKCRQRLIREGGFGMAEMYFVPTPPPPWPQSGFLLAATWIRRGWRGGMTLTQTSNFVLGRKTDV